MIGFLPLYFIWKYYSALAIEYNKSRAFSILGFIAYVAGIFIFAALLGALSVAGVIGEIEEMNNTLLSLICTPFGVLCCWGLYRMLQNRWITKAETTPESEVLDQNLDQNIG